MPESVLRNQEEKREDGDDNDGSESGGGGQDIPSYFWLATNFWFQFCVETKRSFT